MRFGILLFIFCAVTAVYTPLTLAQAEIFTSTTSTSTAEGGGFFDTVIENITGIKESAKEIIPSSQSVLGAATEKRLTNLAANISNRLDGLSARLRHIANRLDVRIKTQAEAGYNVETARTSLQKAYANLDAAAAELKNIDSAVYQAFRSLTPKADWLKVRATYVRARDNIREAHTELRNTVTNLKSATPATPVATSTATST